MVLRFMVLSLLGYVFINSNVRLCLFFVFLVSGLWYYIFIKFFLKGEMKVLKCMENLFGLYGIFISIIS